MIKDHKRPPLIYIDIDGTKSNEKSVLIYGHFDK